VKKGKRVGRLAEMIRHYLKNPYIIKSKVQPVFGSYIIIIIIIMSIVSSGT
jgi:hypothetical protein